MSSSGLILVSSNGASWASETSSTSEDLYGVASNSSFFVTVGSNGIIRAQTVTTSTDATLSNLTINQGSLTPTFASGTTSYSASVANTTTSITVTPTASSTNATVKVNGSTVTSGNASSSIGLAVDSNTISVVVTTQDGSTTQTYTITVTRAAATSTDATLSNLSVNQGTLSPAFASGTISYSVSVGNSATSITVTPTVNQANATVTLNGTTTTSGSSQTIPLAVGANTIQAVVTAQDGSKTKMYTITVTREASSNANLNGLTLSSGTLSPIFTSGTTSYTSSVPNGTTSIQVRPTVADYPASVTVNGSYVSSGSDSDTIALNTGSNTISVVVTAQNNSTKTYTIRITRLENPNLSDLTISAGTLIPTFDANQLSYGATVEYASSSLQVTPTTVGIPQTLTVAGLNANSGSATSVALSVGDNTIPITVTMSDGATRTYTLTVTRSPISDSDAVSQTYDSLDIGYAAGDRSDSVTQDLDLLFNGTHSTMISWVSSSPNVIQNDGTVTRPSYPNSDAPVTLNALIQKGTVLKVKTFSLLVKAVPITDVQAVAEDTVALQVGYASGDDASSITQNLSLPVSGSNGTMIDWTSDQPILIDENGKVTRGAYKDGDQNVNLTARIVRGSATDTRVFNVTVKAIPASTVTDLQTLDVKGYALTPTFDRGIHQYTLSVPNAIDSVTVTASVYAEGTTFTIQGLAVANGDSSGPIALVTGKNTIAIKTTAQDGQTQDVYTIEIERAAASNPGGGNNGGTTEPVSNGETVITTPTPSSAPEPTGFEIRVNGRLVQIATGALTQINGQTVFNAVIDTEKLMTLLAEEGDNPLIVLPITASADKVNT